MQATYFHMNEVVEQTPDALFKIIIIGDSGVGKSCFLLQFTEGDFKEDHNVTIGVEYGAKVLSVSGKNIKLQIWDTAGQESFRAITRTFYRNANGVILMYDLTRGESFDSLVDWLKEVKQNSDPDVAIYLVGNMSDLNEEREVDTERAEKFVQENGLSGCIEASAKTANNVQLVFQKVAELLYQRQTDRDSRAAPKAETAQPVVQLRPTQTLKKKKKCC